LTIAIDTGGTFTDCVWQDDLGRLQVLKVPSTPADPSLAIGVALEQIAGDGQVVLLHGTTVGTNAVLERRGARVAFITTEGFEDTLEIGRQARPKLYDFFFDKIPPLVAADDCIGVAERVSKNGEVLTPLDANALQRLTQRLDGVDAIAVSFLFSFANPEHEKAAGAVLRSSGVPVTLSHELLPEFREYERASTVVMNAYLQPITSTYLDRLHQRVRGRVFLMQSNGGLASLERAAREPVRTVLSGPAGGVIGATRIAQASGINRIIGFDMGGTSTDVWLVEDEPHTTSEAEVAGLPVRVPMLNIHTVGAGGGSLAWFDPAGALRVGPRSAGADPGPICYGKGEEPTVTDANLLLGRLPAEAQLAGMRSLDLERTRALIHRWLRAQHRPESLEQFAEGVIRVVNSNMEKAIRLVSIEKGYDPRQFTLAAFGGAGALHACELAEGLEIPRVLVPYLPGALSALGILLSDVARDYSRTVLLPETRTLPLRQVNTVIAELKEQAKRELRNEGWPGQPHFQPRVDLRYAGQGYEISVPLAANSFADFETEHQRVYGFKFDQPIEIVTVRLTATIARAPKKWIAPKTPAKNASHRVTLRSSGKNVAAMLLERGARRSISGPAIITEYSATTFVPSNWKAAEDRHGNLVLSRVGRKK
jgi:N-methylhydantoinase A